ncbi:Rha family transcriptional regulator [Pseudomonas sp. TH43]|uniref:Rha family transcriptional regulator n=1 Tax=Pseudomonas sp. TH43 TaxID=2796407 RepID=UPI0019134417|nr:Rha family transcriptional regulator [Pseudomonas sp. TH43]MBK5373530.1 Rha family transcriptional regulator [Pseudomonas sp. TH43]
MNTQNAYVNTPNSVATHFTNSESVSRTTMSSREIAKLTGKAHKHVLSDIRSMLKELEIDWADCSAQYQDSTGRSLPCFNLNRELTDTLLTGYSAKMRLAVIRRWHELEKQQGAREQVMLSGTKVVGELAILECFTRLLKPAPSSQVMMLNQIAANNGLDAKFLPGYAVDAAPDAVGGSSMPTKAVTALIKDNAISSTAPGFNRALAAHGFLKTMQRKNSKQETVEFWSVTEKGLAYGKNLTSPQCPRETQPHWYVDRFPELAKLVGKA